jgi:hypothetical protein
MQALILTTLLAYPAWGTAACSVEQPVLTQHWEKYSDDEWHLYDGQIQVAGYRPSKDEFRRLDKKTREWCSPEPAPWRVPGNVAGSASDRTKTPTPPFQNFGVVREKISHEEKHHVNGTRVSREQAYQAITAGALEDDSKKGHLTIIGNPSDRQKVLEDLDKHAELARLKSDYHVQAYGPGDWAVSEAGFVTSGTPTIYCQAAGGQVLFRKDRYEGAENLAEELRRLRPDYDPKKDKPSLIDLSPKFMLNINPWWVVAGLIVVYLLTRGRKTA